MNIIRDKKGDMEYLIKIISWIVFFGIILLAVFFLIRRFTVGVA